MNDEEIVTVLSRQFLDRVSKHFNVKTGYLFGSRARGDCQPESDVDVALLLSGSREDFLDCKLIMDDIAYDTLLETGFRIQPLPVWEEDWEHPHLYPNPYLLRNIKRDGIQL